MKIDIRWLSVIALWLLIAASLVGGSLMTFGRAQTSWWTTGTFAQIREQSSDQIISGELHFPLLFQWASTLLAVTCACLLRTIDRWCPPARASPQDRTKHSVLDKLIVASRRIFFYQLPPRKFWSWMTSGMSVIDLFVWLFFIGLAAVWLFETTSHSWAADDEKAEANGWDLNDLAVQRIHDTASCFNLGVQGVRILVFYPVSRSNFIHWLFGVDYHTVIRYHIFFANGVVFLSWASAALNMVVWGAKGQFGDAFRYNDNDKSNVGGFVATLLLTILYVSSLEWFRKNYFHAWKVIHVFTAFAFICVSLMYNPSIGFYVLPGILLYLLDKTLRGWQYMNSTLLYPGQDIVQSKGVITVSLDWALGSWMKPGQTVYLTIPAIHKYQAHPFSIASVTSIESNDQQDPNDPESHPSPQDKSRSRIQTILHIKAGRGPWTTDLMNLVKDSKISIQCIVEGPYDHLPSLPAHNVVVMVAGGLGITPILGILRQWLAQPSLAPSTVYLCWASRSYEELCLLDSALVDLASAGSWLCLHLHFTGQHVLVKNKVLFPSDKEGAIQQENSEARSNESKTLTSNSSFWSLRTSLFGYRRSSTSSIAPAPMTEDATAELPVPACREGKALLTPVASNHPLHYLLLAIVCFFGAYAGLQIPTYYVIKGHFSNWFILGLMYVGCLMVGSMLPPVLALVAIAAFHKFMANYKRKPQSGSWDGGAKDLINSSVQDDPDGGLRLSSRLSCFSVPLSTRRPDLKALLAKIKATHADEIEIPVLVGGPEAMMEASRNEIEEQNGMAGCYYWFRKVTCL